jgi:MFS family permease
VAVINQAPHAVLHENHSKWWFVIAGFIALLVGVNTVNILFNILTPTLTKEFGWNRAEISAGLSIFTVFDGIGIFVMGFLLDKLSPRKVAIPMAAIFGFGIAALALLPGNLVMLYVICAFIGCGAAAATAVAHSAVVAAWFTSSRGLALGILNVGLGLCGVIMPFVIGGLVPALGWRGTVVAVGLICAIVPILVYGLVTKMPPQFEADRRRAAASSGGMAGVPLLQIMKSSRHFWFIAASIFLVSAATFGILSQVVAIVTDGEFGMPAALAVLSTVSLSSIAARFIVGFLLDKIFAPHLTAAIFLVCGIGVMVLTQGSNLPLLYLGAIMIGLGLGAEGDIAAYLVSRYMPKFSFGRVFGVVMFLYAQGGAVGIFILGWSYSATGSYTTAAWGIAAMVMVAAVLTVLLGPYKYAVDGSLLERPKETAEIV